MLSSLISCDLTVPCPSPLPELGRIWLDSTRRRDHSPRDPPPLCSALLPGHFQLLPQLPLLHQQLHAHLAFSGSPRWLHGRVPLSSQTQCVCDRSSGPFLPRESLFWAKNRLNIIIFTCSMPAYTGNSPGNRLNIYITNPRFQRSQQIFNFSNFPYLLKSSKSSNIFFRLYGALLVLLVILPQLHHMKNKSICIIQLILGRIK